MPRLVIFLRNIHAGEIPGRGRVQIPSLAAGVALLLLLVVVVIVDNPPTLCQSGPTPLSKNDILELLTGSVSAEKVAEMAKDRKIDFEVTPEVEKELHDAGADDLLVNVLHDVAPQPRIYRYLAVRNPLTLKQTAQLAIPFFGAYKGIKDVTVFSNGTISIRNHTFYYEVAGSGSMEHDKGSVQFPLDQITDVQSEKLKKPYSCAKSVKCTDSLEVLTKEANKRLRFMVQNTPDQPELGEVLLDALHHNH